MLAAETAAQQAGDVLLVSELRFATAELRGLDEPVEIFALDRPDRSSSAAAAPWGRFWQGFLEGDALPLECASGIDVPDEGGFLLRPIRSGLHSASWEVDGRRRICVPPRCCHSDAGLPRPQSISNELFIEIRYSLPPSLLSHFDFADMHSGAFRVFALPMPDGELRVLLALDVATVDTVLAPYAPPSKPPPGSVADRFERFLIAAAGAPPSAHWATTTDMNRGDTADCASATAAAPAPAAASSSEETTRRGDSRAAGVDDGGVARGLFPHQRRSVAWMERIETADAAACVLSCAPLDVAGRAFGSHYEVRLPRGGVIAHPPGAGKTRIGCALVARRVSPTLIMCPAHLLPMWAGELSAALGVMGEAVAAHSSGAARASATSASPAEPSRSEELLGFMWRPAARAASQETGEAQLLLLGYHAMGRLQMKRQAAEPTAATVAAAASTPEPPPLCSQRQMWLREEEERSHAAWASAAPLVVLDVGTEARAADPAAEAPCGAPECTVCVRASRLMLDEPQDTTDEEAASLMRLSHSFGARWLFCGTAAAAVPLLGPLLMGRHSWRSAVTVDEWRAQPTLPHIFRHRFLRDPAWACLPRPPVAVHDELVTASREEAVEAQVAALSGYVIDSVLLLSFGPHAAALAVHERRRLARSGAQRQPTRSGSHVRRGRGAAAREADSAMAVPKEARDTAWSLPPDESINGIGDVDGPAMGAEVSSPANVSAFTGDGARGEGLAEGAEGAEGEESESESESESTDEGDSEEDETWAMQPLMPLSEWSGVESRCRRRLAKVQCRLVKLRRRREREQRAFQLEGSIGRTGVLRRLAFLEESSLSLQWGSRDADETDRGSTPGGFRCGWHDVAEATLAAAEWNADLANDGAIVGPLFRLPRATHDDERHSQVQAACPHRHEPLGPVAVGAQGDAIYVTTEDEAANDYCGAAWRAASIGGTALLVACSTETTRPMSFAAEQNAPPIPAAMVPASEAARMLRCIDESNGGAHASLLVRSVAIVEDEAGGGGGVEEGRMADVVALDDASEQSMHLRIVQLEEEEARLEKALRFSTKQRRAATASHTEEDEQAGVCPICLELPDAVCVLPECFHCLCRHCLQRAVGAGTSFRCPLCRVPVESWQVSVYRTVRADQPTSSPPPSLPIDANTWRQQPSKLQRLLQMVHQLLCEGEDERVLIYTQWLAHVEHIGTVLDAANLSSLQMSGDLGACMRCLQAFGQPGQPRVLVLSSQHHSSGINLQTARNLIVVHPYCTPSATAPEFVSFKQLRAFEQQAIGRIRRFPQCKTVRVWRLIGRDSVEQGLYRGGYVA